MRDTCDGRTGGRSDGRKLLQAFSAPELRVFADRGVCLFVSALTHGRGLECVTVSVLLLPSLCETEGCPYTLSVLSMFNFFFSKQASL